MTKKKWNLVIDIDRCNGCYNCALAVKDEYVDNGSTSVFAPQPRHGHNWFDVRQTERGQYPALDVAYLPVTCNHCDDPPCLKAAKNGAVIKRDDGLVVIDPVASRGQKDIVDACPYGAVFWNDELQIPQHWPFDAHLLDRGWKAPRVVEVCATGAITALCVDDEEMRSKAQAEKLSVRRPEFGTRPRIYYKNVDRIESQFIAGTVVLRRQGVSDCIEGARVSLMLSTKEAAVTTTDAFGDFRFDHLETGSGPWLVEIEVQGRTQSVEVLPLESSRFVGKIHFEEAG